MAKGGDEGGCVYSTENGMFYRLSQKRLHLIVAGANALCRHNVQRTQSSHKRTDLSAHS